MAHQPSAGRRAPRARAGRRPGGPGTAIPLRTSGTARRRRRRRSSIRPTRRRAAAASPPRRVRPSAGRWPAGPVTTASMAVPRRPPSRTRAGQAKSGPAWLISAASIAVLPMPASPLIIRNCPVPPRRVAEHRAGGGQCRLPPDEPVGWTHGSIMAGQGRSSNTRFIGAGTSEPADAAEPGVGGQGPQPLLAGLGAQRLRGRGCLLGHRVRRACQGRDGVEHAPVRVEVALDVIGAQRLEQAAPLRSARRPPGPASARRGDRRGRAGSRRR